MPIFLDLLRNPNKLVRLAVLFTFIPVIISLNNDLIVPIFWAVAVLLAILQYHPMNKRFRKWRMMDPVIRVAFLVMIFGFVYVPAFIWVVVPLELNVIWISLVSLLLYIISANTLFDKLDEYPYRPIFRSEVDNSTLDRNFDITIIASVIALFLTISIILIESFVQSSASELITMGSLRWLTFFGLIFINAFIYNLFIQEIEWKPKSGYTRFEIQQEIEVPDSIQPQELTSYFHKIEREQPNEEFFEFLDNNLPDLVKRFRNLEYTSAFQSLVRIFCHWGEKAADRLHYLNLLVMASLSRFRVLGLVPMYNRHSFYSYMGLLYKLRLLPTDWLEVIRYEIGEQKDMYHQLDWIVEIPYTPEIHDKVKWMALWNLKIFKGEEGYNILEEHMLNQPFDLGVMEDWVQDIWETTFTYLKLFFGKEGRQAYEGKLSLDDSLIFLARKQTLEDFQIAKDAAKADLLDPKDRLVEVEKKEGDKAKSARQYLAFLEEENYAELDDQDSEVTYLKQAFLRNIGDWPIFLMKIGILILAVGINLFGLYLIGKYINEEIMLLLLALEIPSIFFMSISTEMGGVMNEKRAQLDANIRPNRDFGSKSLDSGLTYGSAEKFFYALLLTFGYVWFLV